MMWEADAEGVASSWYCQDRASATTLLLPASVTANNSRTYVGDCCIRGHIFLLKNAKGFPDCWRTAPTATNEASVSTWKGLDQSGR